MFKNLFKSQKGIELIKQRHEEFMSIIEFFQSKGFLSIFFKNCL